MVSVEISGVSEQRLFQLSNLRAVRELGFPGQKLNYFELSRPAHAYKIFQSAVAWMRNRVGSSPSIKYIFLPVWSYEKRKKRSSSNVANSSRLVCLGKKWKRRVRAESTCQEISITNLYVGELTSTSTATCKSITSVRQAGQEEVGWYGRRSRKLIESGSTICCARSLCIASRRFDAILTRKIRRVSWQSGNVPPNPHPR